MHAARALLEGREQAIASSARAWGRPGVQFAQGAPHNSSLRYSQLQCGIGDELCGDFECCR
eukprot:202130-Lingulodinium_polyedra.AAC.1